MFDYKSFADEMIKQARPLLPKYFKNEEKNFVCNTMNRYIEIAGKELAESYSFSSDAQLSICQVIAEWTFHKSVDLIEASFPNEYIDSILESIAYTIFEVAKQAYDKKYNKKELAEIIEYHVNKRFKYLLGELYSKNIIDKNLYIKTLNQSNIDKMRNDNKDHSSSYSIGQNDQKLLNDQVLLSYSKNLTYKYLIKAAHSLKNASMQSKDRREVLFHLKTGAEQIINSIQVCIKEYSIQQVERIITVAMEILFQRIVVMYKNNILYDIDLSIDCITYFANLIFYIETRGVNANDKAKDMFEYANLFSNQELRKYLLDNKLLTKEQTAKVFDKSYIVYLEKEIYKQKTFNYIKYLLIFCMSYFILKLIFQIFILPGLHNS